MHQLKQMAGIATDSKNVPKIPMRDLSQNREIVNTDTNGLIESRESFCLFPGNKVHIEDVTSSKVFIIDELRKL